MLERDVTCAIVRSDGARLTRSVCSWSAKTEIPVSVAVSKPVFETENVYVSGASESSEKRPDASVVTVAVCDGLVATTRAPATGALLEVTTVPVRAPVVPATETTGIDATPAARLRRKSERLKECMHVPNCQTVLHASS